MYKFEQRAGLTDASYTPHKGLTAEETRHHHRMPESLHVRHSKHIQDQAFLKVPPALSRACFQLTDVLVLGTVQKLQIQSMESREERQSSSSAQSTPSSTPHSSPKQQRRYTHKHRHTYTQTHLHGHVLSKPFVVIVQELVQQHRVRHEHQLFQRQRGHRRRCGGRRGAVERLRASATRPQVNLWPGLWPVSLR